MIVSPMATDDRILDAALDVFGEHGVRRGTLGEVAQCAGVGRATLYRYFAGKDALVAALVLREARLLFAMLDDELAGTDDPAELLERGLIAAYRHLREHALLQRVLREEPEEVLPWLTVRAAPLLTAAVEFGTPYVERAVKAERIPRVEPRIAAEWAARILLSLLLTPSVTVDLDDERDLRAFVGWLIQGGPDATRPARRRR